VSLTIVASLPVVYLRSYRVDALHRLLSCCTRESGRKKEKRGKEGGKKKGRGSRVEDFVHDLVGCLSKANVVLFG